MKGSSLLAVFISLIVGIINPVFAQSKKAEREKEKAAAVSRLLESKRFTFIPQTVMPFRGWNINLTTDFDLDVKNDTLQSYLPYYGRAFTGVIGQTSSPLSFTSTKFNYTATKGKRGSTDIKIEIKDSTTDVRQYLLNISELGYATLQVLSNNRDPITFNGSISDLQ